MSKKDHFKGKSALEHIKEARKRSTQETNPSHGLEAPGHIIAGADAAKEITIIAFLFWIVFSGCHFTFQQKTLMLSLAFFGFLVWKVCRSAILGWSRLEKLNRVISEEKKEIETNREQEKEELKEMYAAKGFKGKMLDDVVEVLMADDNRLLMVMLEEELGMSLESYEHPLKQACGALIGIVVSAIVIVSCVSLLQIWGMILATGIITLASSWITAAVEGNKKVPIIVWNLASLFVAAISTYFLTQMVN